MEPHGPPSAAPPPREFLGHAGVQTTQVYAHANRNKMQRVVERM